MTTAQHNGEHGPGQDMVFKRMKNTKTKKSHMDYLDDCDNADSEMVTRLTGTRTSPDSAIDTGTTPSAGIFSKLSVGTPLANEIIIM